MSTVTLSRDKYLLLKQRAAAYDLIVGIMENEAFLGSIARGLARSLFFRSRSSI